MNLIKQLFLTLILLCASQAFAKPELGKDYSILNPAMPTHSGKKIEVLEFFSYDCIHCYNFNPLMQAWTKRMPDDVSLTYVPVVYRADMEIPARAFYAVEYLGLHNKLHDTLFDIWHSSNPPYDKASLINALTPYGVDVTKFQNAYNAYSISQALERARGLAYTLDIHMQKNDYHIRSTPTLIIGGKYVISGESAHTIKLLYALIEKVRKEKKH
ncbi:thiol:disulfide interchange protein DsbA [Psychromonas ingrahamii 37]|uniref:Thiol:disulfide interchange protein n=1 Tax=Psychromonas ingrahamii (strain DSM 17664 / CCUG 51855 / 37) TaxID=357804 RepID=A1SSE6_PSYIN|nr:thiol:disulfide interchange protein DsbA/DsbL [Psychromonas ingrahamii]ABM02411.1 thiol:disulfide interchange protein DsbA [Psychromonas ingrahamii 37]